jgi:hypothetical protein
MTDARHRGFWHRAGLWGGAGAMLLVTAIASEGCSDPETRPTTATSTTTTSSTAGSTSSSGSGGAGGEGGAGGGTAGLDITTACNDDGFSTPFDATPDPEGINVFFTALDVQGKAGVWKGAVAGGAPCSPVHVGDPLVAPFSIAATSDNKTLIIADLGSDDANESDAGHIFTMPIGGGVPTVLAGTEGRKPRGVDTRKDGAGDIVYFTGTDPVTKERGVFNVLAAGGPITKVASGAPFVDPSGIAVSATGKSYVCDTTGTPTGTANILVVEDTGMTSAYVSNLRVGYPCGIALTTNDQNLIVSAMDPATETDVLVTISLETKVVEYFSTGINTFTEPAGMHRAKNVETFAWVDSKANKFGTVFTVKLK